MATIGGAAMVGMGAVALKFSNDFDKVFDNIAAQSGATGDELEDLEQSFKDVFRSVPVDMATAGAAITTFNTLTGATGETLERLAEQAINAGRLLGEDTAALTENAARAMNVFGLSAEEGAEALDAVMVASQQTGQPMTALLGTLQTYGPVLANLGLGLQESTAFFGAMHKAGIDVSRIMPGINAAMRKLAGQGVTDLKGALFDSMVAIKGATTDTEALNIATETFGAEGAQRMSLAIRQGLLDDLPVLEAALNDSEGAIDDLAASTDDWREKLQIIKQQALLAAEPFLEYGGAALTAAGSLTLVAANAGGAISALKGLASQGPKVAAAMRALGAASMTAIPALLAVAAAVALVIAANELFGAKTPQWVKDIELLGSKEQQLAEFKLRVAAASRLEKEWLEKVIGSLEDEIVAADKAAEANAEFAEDAAKQARTNLPSFEQKILGINEAFDDMTSKADDAFGAINQFKNVPTIEQLELISAMADLNAEIALHEQRLLDGSAATETGRQATEEYIESLEAELAVLDAESTVLDANREQVIAAEQAKLALSGAVGEVTQSESDLIDMVEEASGELGGQQEAIDSVLIPALGRLDHEWGSVASGIILKAGEASGAISNIASVASQSAATIGQILSGIQVSAEQITQTANFGVPVLHQGTSFVQKDTLAFLQKGEAVIPASQNQGANEGAGGVTIIMENATINTGGDDLDDAIEDIGFGVAAAMRERGVRV